MAAQTRRDAGGRAKGPQLRRPRQRAALARYQYFVSATLGSMNKNKQMPPLHPRSRVEGLPPIPPESHRHTIKHRSGDGAFKAPPCDADPADSDQPVTRELPMGFGDEGYEG